MWASRRTTTTRWFVLPQALCFVESLTTIQTNRESQGSRQVCYFLGGFWSRASNYSELGDKKFDESRSSEVVISVFVLEAGGEGWCLWRWRDQGGRRG